MAARRAPLSDFKAKLGELIEAIEEHYQYLQPLADMARRGIAYHNSSLPQRLRYMIEDAVKEHSLNVVVATTTLAEGVDLPFRNTIIADWLVFRRGTERPMPPLLFRNIAGRCGRAGTFTEGDTIIFDNVLGDFAYTSPPNRQKSRNMLLSEPPPLRSLLTEELQTEIDDSAEAILAAQFMAAIGENAANENLAEDFASHLFGAYTGDSLMMHQRVQKMQRSFTDPSQPYVFARAASPIHLTDLGIAINQSGFAPNSAISILNTLSRISITWSTSRMLAHLLRSLSAIPEQYDERWKRKLTRPRTRLMIAPDDLDALINDWLEGASYMDLFAKLPAVMRSSRTPKIENWMQGSSDAESWAEEYDKFLDFMASVIERFLPWILYGCGRLAPFSKKEIADFNWESLRSVVATRIAKSELG